MRSAIPELNRKAQWAGQMDRGFFAFRNLKLFFAFSGENLVFNRKPAFPDAQCTLSKNCLSLLFHFGACCQTGSMWSSCPCTWPHGLLQAAADKCASLDWPSLVFLTQTQCRVIYQLPYSTTDLDVGLESLRHQWQVCAWIARCWHYPWKLNSVYSKPQYSWIRIHKVTNLSRYNPGSNLCQHYARTM